MKKKIHTSMRGVQIDMDSLRSRNEDTIAVGNASMNARGDIIGKGGNVIVRREELARKHHEKSSTASTTVSLKPAMPDKFETPTEALARLTKAANNVVSPKALVDDFEMPEINNQDSFEHDLDKKETKKTKRNLVEKED